MENKNINYFRSLLTLSMVLLALFTGIRLGRVGEHRLKNETDKTRDNISTVMDYISKYYVDYVDIDSLDRKYIPEILKELDPHSIYIPADELQKDNEPLEGNFDGIGITFEIQDDTMVVISVIPDGPSYKAGLHPGDRIVAVDDSLVAGRKIPRNKLVERIRGKAGSKVSVKLKREGAEKPLPVEIVRENVPIRSIDAAYLIAPNTGYVNMNKFAKTTYTEFIDAIDKLHGEGMTNLIIDLRYNPGGFLEQAIAVTSELFADKRLILYTDGRAFIRENKYSEGNGICGNDKIVVLINENSASASELLAGAVQDNDRGTIVGQRSFGKGLVQHMLELPDGAGLRLTVGRYYTPSGRSIQRPYEHGSKGIRDYYEESARRNENGEHLNADSIKQSDTTRYYTASGRTVYGGGGITPDIFVPYEDYAPLLDAITCKRLIQKHAMMFADRFRNELNEIATIEQLDRFFEANDPCEGFANRASTAGLTVPKNDARTDVLLKNIIKSNVGRLTNLDGLGEFVYMNKIDPTVQKALSVLRETE